MTGPYRRTWIASLVTTAMVVAPCAAWYVAGSRGSEQQAQRAMETLRESVGKEARNLAGQLRLRLAAMQQAESRRSHLDYRSRNTAEQLAFSALADGPADPMIWAHFQMDQLGRLTLPNFRSESAERAAPASVERAVLDELECVASSGLSALRRDSPRERERQVRSSEGTLRIGPFAWFTTSIHDGPALVALRQVTSPSAVLTQGFVVLPDALQQLLEGARHSAWVRPGPPSDSGAPLLLGESEWSVELDASTALANQRVRSASERRQFVGRFLGGTAALSLAGLLLVWLIAQADRLALRRAEFAAAAAHELRTPLAGLQLYSEMLAEGIGDPGSRERYARTIAEESARLGRVVSNVLGFAQLEHGSLGVRPTMGDLAACVRDGVERLRPEVEARGAQLELSENGSSVAAWFDADAMHQVLQNLVDNAEKYSREATDRAVRVELEQDDGSPSISVVDRGPGLASSVRKHLFRPFVRNQHDGPAGLGIGLALVRALAHAQQARVSWADEPGGGTRFRVRLLAAPPGDAGSGRPA